MANTTVFAKSRSERSKTCPPTPSERLIASAVGEGSICVQFVHRVLRELAEDGNPHAIAAA